VEWLNLAWQRVWSLAASPSGEKNQR